MIIAGYLATKELFMIKRVYIYNGMRQVKVKRQGISRYSLIEETVYIIIITSITIYKKKN